MSYEYKHNLKINHNRKGYFALSNYEGDCNYKNLVAEEYLLSDKISDRQAKELIKGSSNNYDPFTIHSNFYKPLQAQPFKFTSKEVKDGHYYLANDTTSPLLTTELVELEDGHFEYKNKSYLKVVTQSCHAYWLVRDKSTKLMKQYVKLKNGNPLLLENYVEIFGEDNVNWLEMPEAIITIGEFEDVRVVSSSEHEGISLELRLKQSEIFLAEDERYNSVTISAKVEFLHGWAFLKHAYLKGGTKFKLESIKRDSTCEKRVRGCRLMEWVMFDVPLAYIKENRSGFDVKLKGMHQSRIVKINPYQIKQFLDKITKPYYKNIMK